MRAADVGCSTEPTPLQVICSAHTKAAGWHREPPLMGTTFSKGNFARIFLSSSPRSLVALWAMSGCGIMRNSGSAGCRPASDFCAAHYILSWSAFLTYRLGI
jgi:hypothetical protein